MLCLCLLTLVTKYFIIVSGWLEFNLCILFYILHFLRATMGMHSILVNYVCFSLFSTTIANSLEDCIYELVINTYCFNKIGFFLACLLSIFYPPLSYSLPSLPSPFFTFFSWRCIRFECTPSFTTGLPVSLLYHHTTADLLRKYPIKKCHYCSALQPIYMTKHMMYVWVDIIHVYCL